MYVYSSSYIFCRIGHLYHLSQYIVMAMQGTTHGTLEFLNSGQSKYGLLVLLYEFLVHLEIPQYSYM